MTKIPKKPPETGCFVCFSAKSAGKRLREIVTEKRRILISLIKSTLFACFLAQNAQKRKGCP
jgi:hypothetical protein